MSQDPIIYEGITLMALGMGFVFCFLLLLVGAIRVLTSLSSYFLPVLINKPIVSDKTTAPEDTLFAAISAALHHHKKKFS
ncbi:OadG family protein [Vibrio sp. V23_P3S9T160]|uniref:OadG family protein n=1 Tax=Vibrio sp. V23_P3S9T160 TaxID=1938675 RepID=UPI001372866C|nr:OadG family transporter subunit [Vibrio sp. V23_P3S9T160]NAW98321.1 sodium pump decarboxylase subunit gamma [Vibrio sp. V23_P3S9T160]